MAVMKSRCEDTFASTCERPDFPSWAWRFNRNQYMSHYYPWQIREEQKHPQYRNMGMHRNFRFHSMPQSDPETPAVQLGVNFCSELVNDRQAGFGNAALGRTPGPAPPRLFVYDPKGGGRIDDLYRTNQIWPITEGMTLHGYQPILNSSDGLLPLNPSHYLEQTLGQIAEIPGTFPHFNKSLPTTGPRPPRTCQTKVDTACGATKDLLSMWRDRYAAQQRQHMMGRCSREEPPLSRLPKINLGQRQCQTARR